MSYAVSDQGSGEQGRSNAEPSSGDDLRPPSRTVRIVSEVFNFLLVIFLLPVLLGLAQNALSSTPRLSGMLDKGPEFKVEYGYFMIPALDCPGGQCRQPQSKRLKVQSLNEQPTAIKDVTVNDRPECTDPDRMGLAGLGVALFGPALGIKGKTMSFGDVGYVFSPCEPVRVRIMTDKGESTYNLE